MNTLPLVLLLLGASVLGVALFRRAGLPPVLGYLLVGVLLGPHALNLVGDIRAAQHLAEFGVVFLMFSIGLEFSLPRLFAMKRIVFGLGGWQVTLTAVLVIAIARLAGVTWSAAIVLGGALTMSSTAVLVKLLGERGELESRHGRQVVGVLLFQDLAVVPLLVLIPVFGQPPGEMAEMVGQAVLKAVVVLGIVLFFGQRLLRGWLLFVARGKSSELFVLNVLLITLGLAWLTSLAGLSLALGAFVAGMLISETEFRHQVEEDIKPFRDVLMGLFFVTVGMQLEMTILGQYWPAVLALVLALLLGKGLIVGLLARAFDASPGDALRAALWLCAGGEFGFVLLAESRAASLLDPATEQVVLAALVVSMLLAPLIVHFSDKLVMRIVASEWLLRSMELTRIAAQTIATEKHAIVCGFGRSGQHLVRFLAQEGVSYVALDLDPERVRDAAAGGENVVFGDASRRETLIAAGLKRASIIVISFADVPAAERILNHAHEVRPTLPVIVRVPDDRDMERLFKAGAAEVVPEALESSLMLASHALVLLGVPPRRVLHRIREIRKRRYQLLRGLFHGLTVGDEEEDEVAIRLHSVPLAEGARAVGLRIDELRLDEVGVEVSAIRRRGIRALHPEPDTRLEIGDVVVLLGPADLLDAGEKRLLQG